MISTDFEKHPLNYQLSNDQDGTRRAINPLNTVLILPDGKSRMFQRRAIKRVGGAQPEFLTCLVAELDGVRVYVQGNEIVITKQDLKL